MGSEMCIRDSLAAEQVFGDPDNARRDGSRSPRRDAREGPPAQKEPEKAQGSQQAAPKAKTARVRVQDDAGSARTRSQSFASASSAGHDAAHYATIASDLEAELGKVKLQKTEAPASAATP